MGRARRPPQPRHAGLAGDPAALAGDRAAAGVCAYLNPVEALWSNVKGQELANLACDTLGEVITAAWQGIERVRAAWWLPYSFLRRAGLSVT